MNSKRKINIHDMIGAQAQNNKSTTKTIINKDKTIINKDDEIKTTEIKLSGIKLPPKKIKSQGIKKNIYLDKVSWDIVRKVQKIKAYNSVSETIQNMIKAHKKDL